MSNSKGYPKAMAAGDKLQKQFDAMREQPAEAFTDNPPLFNQAGQANSSARAVPGYYYHTNTKEDQRMKYRIAAANQGTIPERLAADLGLQGPVEDDLVAGGYLRNFKVDLTDQDVEFLEKRRRAHEQVEFDNWLSQVVDLNDPTQNRWLQEKYPEYWKRREKYIDDKIDMEAQLSKIRLRGPNDISDFKLLYAIDQGYVSPATRPLWQGTPAGGRSFKTGWLSLYRSTRTVMGLGSVTTSGRARRATDYGVMPSDGNVSTW